MINNAMQNDETIRVKLKEKTAAKKARLKARTAAQKGKQEALKNKPWYRSDWNTMSEAEKDAHKKKFGLFPYRDKSKQRAHVAAAEQNTSLSASGEAKQQSAATTGAGGANLPQGKLFAMQLSAKNAVDKIDAMEFKTGQEVSFPVESSNGKTFHVQFTAKQAIQKPKYMSMNAHHMGENEKGLGMVDSGCNGCLLSLDDAVMIGEAYGLADISGIGDGEIIDAPIGTYASVLEGPKGKILGLFHNGAGVKEGSSILSVVQLQDGGHHVDPKAVALGGKQCLQTADSFVIPCEIREGLSYIKMTKPTQGDLEGRYPQVHFTSDMK